MRQTERSPAVFSKKPNTEKKRNNLKASSMRCERNPAAAKTLPCFNQCTHTMSAEFTLTHTHTHTHTHTRIYPFPIYLPPIFCFAGNQSRGSEIILYMQHLNILKRLKLSLKYIFCLEIYHQAHVTWACYSAGRGPC